MQILKYDVALIVASGEVFGTSITKTEAI